MVAFGHTEIWIQSAQGQEGNEMWKWKLVENKIPVKIQQPVQIHNPSFMWVEYPLLHWAIKHLLLKQNQFICFYIFFTFYTQSKWKTEIEQNLD